MTQIPQDGAAGTEQPAPTALNLADILNALTLGARLTMHVDPSANSESTGETNGTIPPPISSPQLPPSGAGARQPPSTPLAQESSGSAPASNATVDLPPSVPSLAYNTGAAQVSAVGGGNSAGGSTLVANACSPESGSTSAGKAKAVANNGPCAECAARGCLPPPTPDEDETIQPTISDDASTCWYVVTAGRRVGVFGHWSNTASLVVGVPGAVYFRSPTRAAAEAAFATALENGAVHVIA